MKTIITALLVLVATMLAPINTNACTSAIFSGKVTADGRPVMWKHRDTDQVNNRIAKYKGEKYSFIALVDSPTKGNSAWSGTNDAGFSIMNTASFNFYENKEIKKNSVSQVMYKALSTCANLEDFEKLLNSMNPLGLETHLAVIDAQGGAAYYECTDTRWIKMDVNDPRMAPLGYIAYTNHSFNGTFNEGLGYIRYNTAVSIINNALNTGKKITPQWVASHLSRSFKNSLLGIDLTQMFKQELQEAQANAYNNSNISNSNSNNQASNSNNFAGNSYSNSNSMSISSSNWSGYFVEQDLISRKESTSATIVHGVKPGENPSHTVMYTILGYPPLGIAIPLMVNQELPEFMTSSKENENAPMCDMVLAVKDREIYNIRRGNGQKYFNFKVLYLNYVTKIDPIERELFKEFNTLLDKWRDGQSASQQKGKQTGEQQTTQEDKEQLATIYAKAYTSFSGILHQ